MNRQLIANQHNPFPDFISFLFQIMLNVKEINTPFCCLLILDTADKCTSSLQHSGRRKVAGDEFAKSEQMMERFGRVLSEKIKNRSICGAVKRTPKICT